VPTTANTGRANQRARTRAAIIDACRDLTRSGEEVTMPRVAEQAMVSEATAYRYFPDLVSLLRAALGGLWPDPADALAPVAASADPAERVAFACAYLLRGVHTYQGSVRAMIAGTITNPVAPGAARPGYRFGLIDYALAPFGDHPATPDPTATDPATTDPATTDPSLPAGLPRLAPDAMTRLKQDLAMVVSAEAFFTLTDLCGLTPEDAIASAVRTAATITAAAFAAA